MQTAMPPANNAACLMKGIQTLPEEYDSMLMALNTSTRDTAQRAKMMTHITESPLRWM